MLFTSLYRKKKKKFAKVLFRAILQLHCIFIQLVNLQTLPKQS